MVWFRWIYLGLALIFTGTAASPAFAGDHLSGANRIQWVPIKTVVAGQSLESDISLPLFGKDAWRFVLTLDISSDQPGFSAEDAFAPWSALELNFDSAPGAGLKQVALGADFDLRIHGNAYVKMTYLRLNARENYMDAIHQCLSTDSQDSVEALECAVVQLRIQF